MKDNFEFLRITSPERKEVQKTFLVIKYLPPKTLLDNIIKELWTKPERELQYFAQELTSKYKKQFKVPYIKLLEYMITHKSWWGTVDFIASNLVGEYFTLFLKQRRKHVEKWLNLGNMWLQRTAIIFQLKYKNEVDTELLSFAIQSMLGSKEFYINKAIGWSLRQYGKFNPSGVLDFTNKTKLANSSRKEALRLVL